MPPIKTPPRSAAAKAVTPPRHSRTRTALIEAGKRMLSNGRMAGASIDDIVREADVAKGSFFNHFADRDDLTSHVLSTVRTDLEASIDMANRGIVDPPTRLARGLLASFRYGMVNQIGARVLLHDIAESGDLALTHPALLRDLQAGIAQKSFRLEDVEAGVVLVLGLSDLGLSRLLDLRLDFDHARNVMRDICAAMLRGLGVDSRRLDRVVDESLADIIDMPRQKGG